MIARAYSVELNGIDPVLVQVEADMSRGAPAFEIVGMPDAAVREARDRVRLAMKNCGQVSLRGRLVVNLAPAAARKTGAVHDLAMLVAALSAMGELRAELEGLVFLGELSLSGEVRPARGILPMVLDLAKLGVRGVFVPAANAREASFAEGVEIYPVYEAAQVLEHLRGQRLCRPVKRGDYPVAPPERAVDMADVKGQSAAKRAAEIAAAGGHNMILIGAPGTGKSMIAKRIPTILPPMSPEECIETTKIYSVKGLLAAEEGLVSRRPFRAPHHSVSAVGLLGGGSPPRPGEVSLAHNGVLFLDELPEFARATIEALRQPLEERTIHLTRAAGQLRCPSDFMLIAAMNPCPCGYYGHPTKTCTCSRTAIHNYLARISGPLLDRIDLQIEVSPLSFAELGEQARGESSAEIASRVAAARERQARRFAGSPIRVNARIPAAQIATLCPLSPDARKLLSIAFDRLQFSARGHDRILLLARTIADLAGEEILSAHSIAEAISYRSLDRYWKP